MERFNEHEWPASNIVEDFDNLLIRLEREHGLHFKDPRHDVARRFLNEIVEFEAMEEEQRSSLKPWEKVPENPI